MTKRQDQARERRVTALAQSETNIHERLVSLRGDIDAIATVLDRITLPRRPRLHAGHAELDLLGNLLSFPRRARRR